jgi:copper chaperone CopZ
LTDSTRRLWGTGLNAAAMVVGVLALAVGGPWLVRELRELPDSRALAARSGERIVTLEIAGMTCSGCAARLQSELSSVAGVSTAQVRHGQERAYVVCAPGVADTALVGAVHRAGPGFQVTIAGR